MKNIAILLISFMFFSFSGPASVEAPKAIPENNVFNPAPADDKDNSKDKMSVTESDFNQMIKIFYRLYASAVKTRAGVPLEIRADWGNSTVNAYATREVDSWVIHLYGGMARAEGMTKDSLALIICHELGHHLGGAPRTFLYDRWPSAEGQADYWASSKCLKKYYAYLAAEAIASHEAIPEKVVASCASTYKNPEEVTVCLKTMLATMDFSNFVNNLPDTRYATSILARDNREVKGTNTNDYPRPQCRIDTLFQGALCTISADTITSDDDAKVGHCNDTTVGTRPRCWYRP